MKSKYLSPGLLLSGFCAGTVTGLFGAGGGMVLIPLLTRLTDLPEESLFPSSVCIIGPICLTSLVLLTRQQPMPVYAALPYLAGSILGGIAAGVWGRKIPTLWLHRCLGLLILWGGFRNLWM